MRPSELVETLAFEMIRLIDGVSLRFVRRRGRRRDMVRREARRKREIADFAGTGPAVAVFRTSRGQVLRWWFLV